MAMRKRKKTIENVVAYTRVSTTEQAEKNLSLPAQLKATTEYAKSKGYNLVRSYKEAGASGTDDNRPVFKAMLQDVMAPSSNVDAILVFQTSRFMRNALQAKINKAALKKCGIRVIAISQETTDDPAGRMMEGMFEVVDQWESEVNGIRTRAAMKENAANGYFNGSRAPFGFRIKKVQVQGIGRGRLIPNPEEIPTHNEVFREYVAGNGSKATARSLNRRGLVYRGKPWNKQKVMKIIAETAAIGTYFWGKVDNKTRLLRDEDEWVPMKVEPIIDVDLFETAQAIRAARNPDKNSGRTGSSPLLLAGLVYCGQCGAAYQLESSGKLSAEGLRKYRYYNCRTFVRVGKEECSGARIPTAKLEQAVLEHIATAVFTEEQCQKIIEDLVDDAGLLREKAAVRRSGIRNELDEVERRLARWMEAFESGGLSADLGADRLRELKARQVELAGTLKTVVPVRPPPYLYTTANIQRFQQDLKDIFLSAKTSVTRNYLRFLVERITITGKRVEINLKREAIITMMSAEGRKTKSEASSDAPDLVLPTVVGWLRQTGSNRRPSD